MNLKAVFQGFAFGAVLLTASAASAGSLDALKPGARFIDELKLPLFAAPLPPGDWTTAYLYDWRDNNKNMLIEIGLLKNDGAAVTEILTIRTNVDPTSAGWLTNGICSRGDVLHNEVMVNLVEKQECWGVNHSVWKEAVDFMPTLGTNFQQFAQNLGLAFPTTTLTSFVRMANRSAFVEMQHHANTATLGVTDPKLGWSDSLWRKDRVANDPARVAVVEKIREQSKAWHEKLKAVGYF